VKESEAQSFEVQSVDELQLLVRPLTAGELIVEADAWLGLLQAKVREISEREIAAKRQRAQIESIERLAEAAEAASRAQEEAAAAVTAARDSGDAEALEDARNREAEAAARREAAVAAADSARALLRAAATDRELRAVTEEARARADSAVAAPATVGDVRRTGDLEEVAAEAQRTADLHQEIQTALLEEATELRDQRTALIDRINVVLDELESKGGDVDASRKYVRAVTGIQIDVSDRNAAWTTLTGWLRSEEGGLRWARNLAEFVLTILAFWVLALVVGKVTERAVTASKRVSTLLRDFLTRVIRRVVLLVGIVVAVSAFEVNVNPVLAAIGGAAFVIAFALQGTLSNLASGMLILAYRPFDVGDVVEAGGVTGKIHSMNLVSTHIRTFDNKLVIVPNNQIWGNVITNATGSDTRRVDLTFGIGYGEDIQKALGILEGIVREHPLVLDDPEPIIRVHELGDSSVNLVCRPWVKTEDYWTVYWDVTRSVKETFDRHGVQIPFPQRDLHVYHQHPANAETGERQSGVAEGAFEPR